ncbi:MAG: hypothetical protein UU13_C0020G0005 [Candidatus Nomurabacteria bacterium GW2011_GWB1_40_7]|uniref:Uncharacterized protein n=1 Tax=Candidatus Nomurabacteria bacterium GW2011_GWB1_40_7 TaxID=1618744 RepID=A0A0G0SYK8_9BACT|nr:MAG: hypothetical protein UU13_C0020G0005 [Candidatus Nomurabacteria bacterium GW2011_GWB1_40_7]
MQKTCSKCGAETSYDGDLHCRKIFIDEINNLLLLHELEKAKDLYFSASFNNEWKKNFLFRQGRELKDLILDEEQRIEAKQRHEKFLASFGMRYEGVSSVSVPRKHRSTYCYNCKESLDNSIDIECNKCGWIICRCCGACGCGYPSPKTE